MFDDIPRPTCRSVYTVSDKHLRHGGSGYETTTVFHCEVCKVSFAQRWRLTRHFKTQKHQSNVELLVTEYLPHSDSPPEV